MFEQQQQYCLHHLVEAQVMATPAAIAVTHSTATLNYQALNQRAEQLAKRLRRHGVGPDVPVGIIARREPATIVAILGVLKAGGAYVPIDPGYPAERIVHIVTDARLQLLLSQSALDVPMTSNAPHRLAIEADDDAVDIDLRQLPAEVSAENAALIVYTSGSTGRPKGVVIPHRAAVARALNGFKYRPGDLQKFSLSVVAHLADVFRPLTAGGTVVFIPDAALRDPAALSAAISSHGTTRTVFLPSHLQTLVESEHVESLRKLDTIIVSGEAATAALVRAVKAKLPGTTLINSYGLTEMSGLACMGEVRDVGALTVGHPLPGVQVYVLDEERQPVAAGQIGEIYLGGSQLAHGYLHQPQATAERFVDNPFGASGQRMYRTGDAGRLHEDGSLEVCGRWDDQVKVRGFRVSLSEIEGWLEQHPSVDRAVVLVQKNADQQRLAAFMRLKAAAAAAADIRQFMADRVAAYMVPAVFARITEFPLLPNGKVDRMRLAETAARDGITSLEDTAAYVAPRTPTEITVARIWADALATQAIGALDNFFDLGGDSLLAMRVLSRLEATYGAQITFQDLLDHPTPEAIGRMVDAKLCFTEAR